ncbi:Peroxisomal leader peptide-processing protease [Liparis tanakae]|uniref:Peroxisomal leader peptide-processing protease n=1 Tax=Liparis tanakae TaxID=230148 RepID=A0A4Z2ISC7_9TELE|nr:Peroxisomal leader peptide-processing protease [Liparis tanakae]
MAQSYNPGESVVVVGYGGLGRRCGPSLTCGVLSKTISLNDQPVMLQTTCAVQAGTSGGAVVRPRTGELLGIVSSNTRDFVAKVTYPHLNFSIPNCLCVGLLCWLADSLSLWRTRLSTSSRKVLSSLWFHPPGNERRSRKTNSDGPAQYTETATHLRCSGAPCRLKRKMTAQRPDPHPLPRILTLSPEAETPLGSGDLAVPVGVARVEEGPDADLVLVQVDGSQLDLVQELEPVPQTLPEISQILSEELHSCQVRCKHCRNHPGLESAVKQPRLNTIS